LVQRTRGSNFLDNGGPKHKIWSHIPVHATLLFSYWLSDSNRHPAQNNFFLSSSLPSHRYDPVPEEDRSLYTIMGCAPSRLDYAAEETVQRREEVLAQARRQRVREVQQKKREEWVRHKSQKRMSNVHRAKSVPDGWGAPDLGYADNRDGPYERFPWSV